MGLWTWMRDLDERVGLRPRHGPFDCAWCVTQKHEGCTGIAVRPRIPGLAVGGIRRVAAQSEACACQVRSHTARD